MKWLKFVNRSDEVPIPSIEQELINIKEKEQALLLKEKELLKKDKILQKKLRLFQKKSDKKVKADKKAAEKMRKARKKLAMVIDARDKINKFKKEECKQTKCKRFFEGSKKSKEEEEKTKKFDFHKSVFKVFGKLKDITCNGYLSQQTKDADRYGSCLQKLFNRPCEFQLGKTHQVNPCLTSFHPYRCDTAADQRSYWDNAAGDCYLMSLRRTPQVWIYRRWPHYYPYYLNTLYQWRTLGQCLLLTVAFILWTPCLILLALCKCLCCTCYTDC